MWRTAPFLLLALACDGSTSGPGDRDGGTSTNDGGTVGRDGSTPRPDSGVDWMPPACEGAGAPISFCDAAAFGGTAPSATADLTIAAGTHVLLDCIADARTLVVEEGACLTASRTSSATLTMHGNLVVRGLLDLGRPDDRIPDSVTTEVVFTGMSDDGYAGTPSTEFGTDFGPPALTPIEVVDSDTGLWVVDSGVVTAAGASKRAWSFLTDGTAPGDATFEVEDASGWKAGDRVALTPTAERSERDHAEQFDEAVVSAVSGNTVTLESAPGFSHAGCTDCMRRGEALNLTRNVVIRSADDTAHAHIAVAHAAVLQLDSVELRWLGPEHSCRTVERRHPIHFHQQEDDADRSFVRHVSIWGGQNGFIQVERSHGVEITDVAGYDTYGVGFNLFYDSSSCGTRCRPDDDAPRVMMVEVIAAKVGIAVRESGCARIQHRQAGYDVSGGEGSGCLRCVATGVGLEGSGSDVSGFQWAESGSGRPSDFTFAECVSHNNAGHGLFIWQNETSPEQPPYRAVRVWSNEGHGVHWGAYGTAYRLHDFVAVDNGLESIGAKAIPANGEPRVDGAILDDFRVLAYVLAQTDANLVRGLSFTGAKPLAFTQLHDRCDGGDEDDPMDSDCARVWLRIENPTFASGVRPFDFGWSANRHSIWEVRGFSHPDAEYADLPADFDLHRSDNEVAGGHLDPRFDAWLVPR
jgi:hypothetical protein